MFFPTFEKGNALVTEPFHCFGLENSTEDTL